MSRGEVILQIITDFVPVDILEKSQSFDAKQILYVEQLLTLFCGPYRLPHTSTTDSP